MVEARKAGTFTAPECRRGARPAETKVVVRFIFRLRCSDDAKRASCHGFARGATNFDLPASYTNFGQSVVDFAGPGGDFVLPGEHLCTKALNDGTTLTIRCWILDMVIGPCRGPAASTTDYCFGAGTSAAAPAVSGVAALIMSAHRGISAARVESMLRASADDLGKPGQDAYYGHGRVNAARAIQ